MDMPLELKLRQFLQLFDPFLVLSLMPALSEVLLSNKQADF